MGIEPNQFNGSLVLRTALISFFSAGKHKLVGDRSVVRFERNRLCPRQYQLFCCSRRLRWRAFWGLTNFKDYWSARFGNI